MSTPQMSTSQPRVAGADPSGQGGQWKAPERPGGMTFLDDAPPPIHDVTRELGLTPPSRYGLAKAETFEADDNTYLIVTGLDESITSVLTVVRDIDTVRIEEDPYARRLHVALGGRERAKAVEEAIARWGSDLGGDAA